MKKSFAWILLVVMLFSVASLAQASSVDLTGMSYDQLVALKDEIDLAIWASEDWQEVSVPQGIYEIGKDIPAGHWTIKPTDGGSSYVKWGDTLDESGKDLGYDGKIYVSESLTSETYKYYEKGSDKTECDFEVAAGQYIVVDNGDVIFTPYTGKPGLGFK